MQNISTTRDRWVWVIAGALMAATLAVELVTPLGYAVWLTYFVAVGVTVFQNRTQVPLIVGALSCVLLAVGFNLAPSSTNSSFSSINRSIGGVSFLAMALVVTQAIRARRQAEFALWLQQAENTVEASLRGDQSPEALADAAVSALCDTLDAQVGALYRIEGERLRLTGGTALPADMPKTLPTNTGQLGEALQRGAVRRVRGVDAGHLQIASSLGKSSCQELLLAPVTADGRVIGIVELGRVTDPRTAGSREQELLARCGENIGLALRTALLRAQLVALLEETQRQSEELQTQQEELRVTNEELEEQSRSLQQSQSDLEQQQAELEQTNVQLEERTQALEAQKQALLVAQNQLVRNSNELSTASRYKSEFLANMSHELRTPLNSALILAKLLADNKDGTLSPEQVKYAQAILSSNNDLLALINDILDLSKIEAGHVELADETIATSSVLQRLRETFEPLARQKVLRCRSRPTPMHRRNWSWIVSVCSRFSRTCWPMRSSSPSTAASVCRSRRRRRDACCSRSRTPASALRANRPRSSSKRSVRPMAARAVAMAAPAWGCRSRAIWRSAWAAASVWTASRDAAVASRWNCRPMAHRPRV